MVANVSLKTIASQPGSSRDSNHVQELPKFSRNSNNIAGRESLNGSDNDVSAKGDGMYSPYRLVPVQSSQTEAMNKQLLNNAAAGIVTALRESGHNYKEFQHNGRSALAMKIPDSNQIHVSFSNGHQPSSLVGRLLHPPTPFQFRIDPATNGIRQVYGPRTLSSMETVAALESLKFSLLAP